MVVFKKKRKQVMTQDLDGLAKINGTSKKIEPCALVIFGATGDLTARKLMPALYSLIHENLLPEEFVCIAFARRAKSNEEFRIEVRTALEKFARIKPLDNATWERFSQRIFYHQSDFDTPEGYQALGRLLSELDGTFKTAGNRVYYLSTQPSYFPIIIEQLHQQKLIYNITHTTDKWSRVIIEKPFGHDYQSAVALQHHISKYLHESQIYRIDHYLGKETVQNLLVFRFANAIFEPLWNHRHIDQVQITMGEELGIGTRGAFWEETGLLRDIVQNHLMQVLSLIAMEPPVQLKADAIRDEKVKVLQAISPFTAAECNKYVVRGQYGPGSYNNAPVLGYRQEDKVHPNSPVETYAAMHFEIDNWRWAGVPFFLRAGKRLPRRVTEITIVFKEVPKVLFSHSAPIESNILTIRIQPNEGISLSINCKVPGLSQIINPVHMDFQYGTRFGSSTPEAYERLICDCMLGDGTLFARNDEVLASWKLMNPILEHWNNTFPHDFPNYPAGSWGPRAADELLARCGRIWEHIQ
jgi:glucose-6-phosphate 1-dehydrogenase